MFWIFWAAMIIAGASSYISLKTKKSWVRIIANVVVFISFPIALFSIGGAAI